MTPESETRDPRLVDLALRIADSQPVDWESARQTAGDLDATLERLRLLERLAQAHAEPKPAPASEPVAFTWGALRVLEKLGEGGFGEVWRAWDPALAREVALKLRRPGAAGSVARWLDEARRLARVRHPNVLTVHGADVHDGRAGLWSDLLRGRTMEDLLRATGPLGADEAALVGVHLCSALAAVHAANLVHGDVKTRNVMREGLPGRAGGAGRIVLMDFGSSHDAARLGSASALSPLYAAPELLAGGKPTVASDLYALGVVLYRLVTGEFPLEAASTDELRALHATGRRVPLRDRRPDLPASFVRAVERALSADPALRPRSAADLEHQLDASRAAAVVGAPRRGRVRHALSVALGAALASAAWLGAREAPKWFAPRFALRPGHPAVVATARLVAGSDETRDVYGAQLAALGDIDGDGRREFAIGAQRTGDDAGRVEIFSERADGSLELRATLRGSERDDLFGFSFATGGDLDGDGHPDFAVSAMEQTVAGEHVGEVYVYRGGPGFPGAPWRVLHGERGHADFGYALGLAADVNGDGRDDLVVGAPVDSRSGPSAGRVYVYFGGPALADRPDVELSSNHPESQFGVTLETSLDFDGDGVRDLVVGGNFDNTEAPHAGHVWVFRGGSNFDGQPDFVLTGPAEGAWFGGHLLNVGDVDGDGEPDLAVGAEFGPGYESGAGALYLYRCGPKHSQRPWRVLRGEHAGDSFGRWFTAADLNGDGWPDIVVGANQHDAGLASTGAIYAYFGGPAMDEDCDWRIEGRLNYEQLGYCVLGVPGRTSREPGSLLGTGTYHFSLGNMRGGRVTRFDFHRYVWSRPRFAQALRRPDVTLTWLGREPARIAASVDGGAHWTTVAERAGGRDTNSQTVALPAPPAARVRWRLTPADPRWSGAVETPDYPITP